MIARLRRARQPGRGSCWRGLFICFAILSSHVAYADGPALAHLSLDGPTLTLTADRAVTDADLAAARQTGLTLHFAQRHLGFPMPPFLTLTLQQGTDTWEVIDLSLQRASPSPPTVFAPDTLRVTPVDLGLSIEGEGLLPGGRLTPIRLYISLRSP